MFQSFSGNSRRPRQINLSGRHGSGPASASRQPTVPAGPQNTLATAQQERLLRQQERNRLNAARTIQRRWRGYKSRRRVRLDQREEWDQLQPARERLDASLWHGRDDLPPFPSEDRCLLELGLLLQFFDVSDRDDLQRLDILSRRLLKTAEVGLFDFGRGAWRLPLVRLAKKSLAALASPEMPSSLVPGQLSLLIFGTGIFPRDMARASTQYYGALSVLVQRETEDGPGRDARRLLIASALAPLRPVNSETTSAYEGFALALLTTPDLQDYPGLLEELRSGVNTKLLATTLAMLLKRTPADSRVRSLDSDARLWLLAHFIHLHRSANDPGDSSAWNPEPEHITVVSYLLWSVADEIGRRIDVEDVAMRSLYDVDGEDREGDRDGQPPQPPMPLPPFVRKRILSLVNQRSVMSLLSHTVLPVPGHSSTPPEARDGSEARRLASYALTLLRIFPRRADEIRMWLYLGSTSRPGAKSEGSDHRVPAIKYFWTAARDTQTFRAIGRDSRAAIELLKQNGQSASASDRLGASQTRAQEDVDEDWRVILIFFELYSFVLKVMDDEEFFSLRSTTSDADQGSSWTRQSALPLEEVKELTTFLKNLAFTMYWNASEISAAAETEDGDGIQSYFSIAVPSKAVTERHGDVETNPPPASLAGVSGMTVDYVKGIVTGLLRMVYERDSRRRFLPTDHWLMTERFDMQGFIPDVVAEEENRHRVQKVDDEDDDPEGLWADADVEDSRSGGIIGNHHTHRTRALEILKRRQRKASRKKYLEAITPRLEILQNMPFFIPFPTRVQIFRAFVLLDQRRRRQGHVDPDQWRMSIMQGSIFHPSLESVTRGSDIISKHHAKIRRESVFDDAYEQFYDLGDGLKEPIQITFVDKFDTVEAGIDGGGVTKEFLTSVTKEAFSPSNGFDLFVENDHSLLHPNPAAVDERKDFLRHAGLKEGSPDWNEQIRDLLRRYEFLGRVIGKCLYEGILVDVGFAGFFLLKWALTGGSGSASKESGYRANLNDLRDLDEQLYQGLLKLKNYPGDVEDFSLNFTVTDTISSPRAAGGTSTRTITRELKPNGTNIPVTNENRLVYISYIARHRLQVQPHLQTSAFLRGLGEIIQPSWLSMFNQSELQTLVGGDSSEIDVADLRDNTLYGGVYSIGDDQQEHSSVKLFWEVMRTLSDSDRRKVLKFVTSTPRAPLLGFGQLNPRFSIRDAGPDQDRLPTTSTCVNLLKLPRYSSASTLREKLLYAVHSGAGFDLS
ncbi:MAG: hypothetical protein M1832_004499 [Thelocarpon impressellum]|nr:MAG: hypothetical protein M1832_004499 [Thelocarpon impressellum]